MEFLLLCGVWIYGIIWCVFDLVWWVFRGKTLSPYDRWVLKSQINH